MRRMYISKEGREDPVHVSDPFPRPLWVPLHDLLLIDPKDDAQTYHDGEDDAD